MPPYFVIQSQRGFWTGTEWTGRLAPIEDDLARALKYIRVAEAAYDLADKLGIEHQIPVQVRLIPARDPQPAEIPAPARPVQGELFA